MKIPVLRSYVAAMPRVAARRQLDDISSTAIGSATVRKEVAEKQVRTLERQARAGTKRKRARKATLADLAGLGITVVTDAP